MKRKWKKEKERKRKDWENVQKWGKEGKRNGENIRKMKRKV